MNDKAFFDIFPKYRLSKVSGFPIFGHFVPKINNTYLQILDFLKITLINLSVKARAFFIFKKLNQFHYLQGTKVIHRLILLIYMQ